MLRDVPEAIDAVYRADWGRIVATVIRLVGVGNVDSYHLLHAARADLLRRIGAAAEAAASYVRALALVTHESESRFLERRLREVQKK